MKTEDTSEPLMSFAVVGLHLTPFANDRARGVDGVLPGGTRECQTAGMRWTRLFDDLEAQLAAQERAELLLEVVDSTRSERGRVLWAERLLATTEQPVRVRVRGVGQLTGTVHEVGADWLVLLIAVQGPARRGEVLVPQKAVLSVSGLSPRADQRATRRLLDLRLALRALSRDRSVVRVTDVEGGQLTGTIDRVGRDHVDVADHADDIPRRAGAVRAVHTVPLAALATVRQI